MKGDVRTMIKIGVDAMGGDYAPKEQVEGVNIALKEMQDIECVLFGDQMAIEEHLNDAHQDRVTIIHTDKTVDMGEKNPIKEMRNNPDSSMALALKALKQGNVDVCVSSGATQALVAGGHMIVHRMKGFKRTAIAPLIPSISRQNTILLDAGANVEIRPEHMFQQAYFAAIYAREILHREHPQVGLINIGTEPGKGRPLDQEVYNLFANTELFEFIGNVEPKAILDPPCDILISDGFTANIVMKTVEGTAKGIGTMLKNELMSTLPGKLGALFASGRLKAFKKGLSAEEIGGALIYGLSAPLIKAQGASKAYGFYNGIRQGKKVVEREVFPKVKAIIDRERDADRQ